MANSSRTCFVLIPFLLIIATLVVLVLVFTGDTSTASVSGDLYFIKVTTTNSAISTFVHDVASDVGLNIQDWYTVGLWNYCSGSSNSTTATYCSPSQAFYWFDPVQVWHLRGTPVMQLIPTSAINTMDTYQQACKWLFCAYIAAIGAAAATLIVSCFAFCRRLGSAVTSFVAIAALVFTAGAATTATILYLGLVDYINTNLGKAGLNATLGTTMFVLVWLAVGTNLLAVVFFLATACCCSGRSDEGETRGADAYERVPSPYAVPSPFAPQPDRWRDQYKGFEMEEAPLYPYQHHRGY